MPPANLSFLPWIRQGAAGAIAAVDTLGSRQPAVADVSVVLNVNTARAAAGDAAPSRAGGRHRHRPSPGGPDGSAPEHQRLRAELLSVDRVRSRRLPVAVHAGAGQHQRPAAAVAVPGGRAAAGRRAAHERARCAAAATQDRGAGQALPRAAGPEGQLGMGAWPGCRRQHGRSERGRSRVEWRATPLALAPCLSATADAEHRLPRLCRADLRPRAQSRPRAGGCRQRAGRAQCVRAGVDADGDGTDAGPAARLLLVDVPHR